jgi:hypothetical protein
MRTLPTLALALASLTVFSCRRCNDPEPQPQCFSGVIVGDACMDGVLIEVDAATPIGRPAGSFGNNVIAAVNFADLASVNQVGQRISFVYRNDPGQQHPNRACTANTVPLPVPHLLLGNISTTGCGTGPAR